MQTANNTSFLDVLGATLNTAAALALAREFPERLTDQTNTARITDTAAVQDAVADARGGYSNQQILTGVALGLGALGLFVLVARAI